MIEGATLDHVAVAMERHVDALGRYVGDLGGRWVSGGFGVGFSPGHVAYANGMRVELLSPHRVEENDFLRRFLDRSGPGPHHLTYKVPDIGAAIEACDDSGLRPVSVDLRDPDWKEAFLHPREATGVLVQLAQAAGEGWMTPPPEGTPVPRRSAATLLHVAHAVRSMEAGRRLFGDLLGAEEVGRGNDIADAWVDLAWPGPGRLRLLAAASEASSLTAWLGGLSGRVHHLAFECDDPGEIPDARPDGDDRWVVDPEHNLGTRLVLTPR